ncbi:MAG: hypothetical protein AB1403_01150 [Candidatus Riflebacteria bacterium]
MRSRKQKLWLTTLFFIFCLFRIAVAEPEALKQLNQQNIVSLTELVDFLEGFCGARDGSLLKSQAPNRGKVVVDELPQHSSEAVYDLVQSIKSQFIQEFGSVEATIDDGQFSGFVAKYGLPVKSDRINTYFSSHDKDSDFKLSLNEFIPTPVEIGESQKMNELTQAYLSGEPYPSGQIPTTPSGKNPPLFATQKQVDERIIRFAQREGLKIVRAPDGRAVAVGPDDRPVPLPPGVLPARFSQARQGLSDFASENGAVFSMENGLPVLKKPDGKQIPVFVWPIELRPPYLKD